MEKRTSSQNLFTEPHHPARAQQMRPSRPESRLYAENPEAEDWMVSPWYDEGKAAADYFDDTHSM